jgi:DNA polymerase III subunit epsilon
MLKVKISFDGQNIKFEYNHEDENEIKKPLRNKGENILGFPKEYVVIDLETTGLNPQFDEIIEVAAIKVVDDQVVDKFSSLVKPKVKIPSFIEQLTGITNELVQNAPPIQHVLPKFIDFVGNSVLVAYNAHFDINFIYDNCLDIANFEFRNNFVDVLRVSRRIYPELSNHRLITLARHLNIKYGNIHRAMEDSIVCNEVFLSCKKFVLENDINLDRCRPCSPNHQKLTTKEIVAKTDKFDLEHPLYNKVCVFTGTLRRLVRQDAMQIVVNLGGSCGDNVTKNTNYLVMGVQDYSKFADGEKSSKTKKAEQLIASGHDLSIITEDVFYELIMDYTESKEAKEA